MIIQNQLNKRGMTYNMCKYIMVILVILICLYLAQSSNAVVLLGNPCRDQTTDEEATMGYMMRWVLIDSDRSRMDTYS